LPPQYGFDANNANCAGEIDKGAVFAGAALAPKCSTLLDPACKVGDTQYDCYLPLGRCATWQCSLTGLGGPAHAEPPGLINVLCRWPAASPSPTPTAVGTGLPTPTATPTPTSTQTSGSSSTPAPSPKPGPKGPLHKIKHVVHHAKKVVVKHVVKHKVEEKPKAKKVESKAEKKKK
jgi:hypothetical protein